MNTREKMLDKYRGCMIGGAAGDALGYAVEFMLLDEINEKYGEQGITNYDLTGGLARISDDTQMTMFTANGLLNAEAGFIRSENDYVNAVRDCYGDWCRTQLYSYKEIKDNNHVKHSWLMNLPAMYSRRAPGNTCMDAICGGCDGTIEHPKNHSKGCGGVMRIAPVGLFVSFPDKAADIAAKLCALTHGHSLGYIPGAALAYMISLIVDDENKLTLKDAVRCTVIEMMKKFAADKHISEFVNIMIKAVKLAESDTDDREAIREIGEGWVAEETLAIATYCAIRYEKDFEKAITVSVNHDGDSDSTGAVTGNILGAYLGMASIPSKFIERLELKKELLELAEDLFYGEPYEEDLEDVSIWKNKYCLNA